MPQLLDVAPISTLRDGKPWEFAERAHCLHCRGGAPTLDQGASAVFMTRHGLYFRGVVKCRCGTNAFCLPILNPGEDTPQPWTPAPTPDPSTTDPGGGAPVLMEAKAA